MKKITVLLFGITILLFIAKFHIAMVRSFDPDEFVHLHHAWLLSRGYIPYRDFFIGVIPVFQWVLAPIFFLPESVMLPIVGRILMFLFYCGTLSLLYLITKYLTKRTVPSLLAVIIALTFPITFDRVLDIRPDTLMMALFLTGTVLLLKNPKEKLALFAGGLAFSFSFLVYMKIAFTLPALAVLILWENRKKRIPAFLSFFCGLAVPVIFLVIVLFAGGLASDALTAITKDAMAFTSNITFSPLDTLSPWPFIYVAKEGVSIPWTVSTILWISAIVGIPVMMRKNKAGGLMFLTYIVFGIIYLFAFPRPYVQIFIPFVYMGSILSSFTIYYGVRQIVFRVRKTRKLPVLIFFVVGFGSIFLTSFIIQYRSRISSQSQQREQMRALESVIAAVPGKETMYDMVGSYIFRPDASYVCCHQCPECAEKLERHVGTLRENLIAKQTKFILLDQNGYLFWKPYPSDVQFLVTHYLPSFWFKLYTPGVWFECTDGQCMQFNLHGKPAFPAPTSSFDLPIKGIYRLSTEPKRQMVTINGISMKDGDTKLFENVIYRFIPTVSFSLTYQLL